MKNRILLTVLDIGYWIGIAVASFGGLTLGMIGVMPMLRDNIFVAQPGIQETSASVFYVGLATTGIGLGLIFAQRKLSRRRSLG